MKIIRYRDSNGQVRHAVEQETGPALDISGDIYSDYEVTSDEAQIDKLLAPIAPTTILAIGLNYRHHAEETGAKVPDYPVLFIKAPNALQNPFDPIEIPRHLQSTQVDYECELAVIIGKTCKNVKREHALDYVLGYTCANDVSARDWQKEKGGGQFCRGKSFDTFAPMGPHLVTADEIPNPNSLRIRTLVNDEVLQDSNTSDMIFDVPALIEFLSGSTTLLAGTVIMTGTPQGVGMARKPPCWLQPGDSVTIEIESIGSLTNPVVTE